MLGNRSSLRIKGKVYHCCIRSAILCGSEAWCLKENIKAINMKNEESYGESHVRLESLDRKTTEDQMDMLGLRETIDRLSTANGVRWYEHKLRRDDDSVLRVALDLEASGKRKQGQPKTWTKQVEKETEKIDLKEDA